MLRFLLIDEVDFSVDEADAVKTFTTDAIPVLDAASAALGGLASWETAAIEEALRAALIDGLGLKPRVAFGPLRVGISGQRVSPPLFESMELLGRSTTLSRLSAARATIKE